MTYVRTLSPGKCILFGEHAVVYGYPAIASAINLNSICNISTYSSNSSILILKNYNQSYNFNTMSELSSSLPEKFRSLVKLLELFSSQFHIELEKIKIELSSELIPGSGLGSSASITVALITGLSEFYNLDLNKSKINDLALEIEKIIHGTPSGIDNTICTFGNAIYYQNKEFNFLELPKDFTLLITYSNIEHNTKQAIERIRKLKEQNPEYVNTLLKSIGEITISAKEKLLAGDYQSLGVLMNENQEYLKDLQVSDKNIDYLTNKALLNGAYGSKLTGAGRGGCVITLASKKNLKKILKIFNSAGYKSFIAQNNTTGVRLEEKE